MTRCVFCGQDPAEPVETATVRCNVRRFKDESFGVWRCGGCGSIHAAQAAGGAELDAYYAGYPAHGKGPSRILRLCFRTLLRRLRRAGVEARHAVLDYGCGSGHMSQYLRSEGFADVTSYDAYVERHADTAALRRTYDLVIAQDVIEHVEEPFELLRELRRLTAPGGLALVGTPDAARIDLTDPEHYKHSLHQPYHRHLATRSALSAAAERTGWAVERVITRKHTETRIPAVNERFIRRYLRAFDDTIDVLSEPPRFRPGLLAPATLAAALFGGLVPRGEDFALLLRAGR